MPPINWHNNNNAGVTSSTDEQDKPDLSTVQKGFLNALALAEKAGLGGTPLKLYNDVIQRGRKEPITDKDFSDEDKAGFKKLIQGKIKDTGQASGKIDYPDYQKYAPGLSENMLGGFQYSSTPEGKINIKDTYGFNINRSGPPIEDNQVIQMLGAWANPRGLAAQIGRQVKPKPGTGVPVDINLDAE